MRQIAYNDFVKHLPHPDPAAYFAALGNPTRLQLLNLMGQRELCVCELVAALEQPQPKISQHLAILRAVGLVQARKEGKWMHYRIVKPQNETLRRILRSTMNLMQQDPAFTAERQRFVAMCE